MKNFFCFVSSFFSLTSLKHTKHIHTHTATEAAVGLNFSPNNKNNLTSQFLLQSLDTYVMDNKMKIKQDKVQRQGDRERERDEKGLH